MALIARSLWLQVLDHASAYEIYVPTDELRGVVSSCDVANDLISAAIYNIITPPLGCDSRTRVIHAPGAKNSLRA